MGDWYGAVTAGCGTVAAVCAAFATWWGPMRAARLAEGLRHSTERARRIADRKLEIFSVLMQERARIGMQERARIGSESSVRALNLIDVVFLECGAVRDAWAKLHKALDQWGALSSHERSRTLAELLATMARDIGLAVDLRADDLDRVYFPTVLAEEQFIRDMERQEALRRLSSQTSPAAEAAQSRTAWPPSPG